ncbi:unnamed protein product [Rotaria magnacalcarata]|uniref:TMEM62 Ig-like domain-containing protein n=1 Tax=Rotaria magnacalcarata TaxID=392030 RepID=A0A819IQ74_9BILA|nr:unnamed protein product [Rotaria magnacalcarata]CAF3803127.1 unnamed protein product [Rotaria magnacalcarata]CAF3805569.1 unnamed protein product [Rotaria magnacalcarata]CAF3918099.1 unnamed protein product [Rotaria magnacalcarata]CAF3971041.1 unnamed protein product [Rotaria magnacalcarata]
MFSFIVILVLLNITSSYSSISNKQFVISNEYLGNSGRHLFHFVQISDTHITHLDHADRMEQFEQFCNEIIKTLVKPQVTIVTGDLVDSVSGLKHSHDRLFGTAQYEREWNLYRDILNRTNVTAHTKWLDIKGNHDTFMDPDPDSSKSFYRVYSHQGHNHSGSYEYTLRTKDGDDYSFVAVDMCLKPGVGRPFNFFGHITKKETQILLEIAKKIKNSTSIIFFGHYPLSFTYSKGLDHIMKYGIVYLNGHLHSGIKHLYARHSNGLLDIELGDWKRQRRFRIMTIDSGLLSFEDFRFSQPIYALISNPKAAKFQTPREPFYRLNQSTHIRIVIFSKLSIINVNVSIDEQYVGSAVQSIDNQNLFVLPWNVSLYDDGNLHQIFVGIKDNGNNTVILTHEFSVSFTTITRWDPSQIILTIHQPTFGLVILVSSLSIYILTLLYYRYHTKRNSGPWYIGYLTQGHFGAVFLWGTLIQGVYLPPDLQIFGGTFQLYSFLFPLTYTLSSSCFYRYHQQLQLNTNIVKYRFNRCCRLYSVYIVFINTSAIILFWSFVMTASYKLSWIISPFGLILVLFSMILYLKSHRLKIEDFKLKKTNEIINSINQDNSKLID